MSNILTLNLINSLNSDIKWVTSQFPDGDTHVELDEFDRKDALVRVICRITNAQELYLLLLVCDILNRQEVKFHLNITYLMSMRMDRVMNFQRPYNLKVVVKMISSYRPESVVIIGIHSNTTRELFRKEGVVVSSLNIRLHELKVPTDIDLLLFPDYNAYNSLHYLRLSSIHVSENYANVNIDYCRKHRDIETGQIFIDYIPDVLDNKKICIFDDLVDGGGTVCAVIKHIRETNPNVEIHVAATHWVNDKGIENILAYPNCFIHMTNSYKDRLNDINHSRIFQYNVLNNFNNVYPEN